jgi:hypothetical protein
MKWLSLILCLATFAWAAPHRTVAIQVLQLFTSEEEIAKTAPATLFTPQVTISRKVTVRDPVYEVGMPDGTKAIVRCDEDKDCLDLALGTYDAEVNKGHILILVRHLVGKPKYSSDGTLLPRKTKITKDQYKFIR